jgi:mannose-6-phosphate isomerase
MSPVEQDTGHPELRELRSRLLHWLHESALPLWAERGIDARNGSFFEAIGQDGVPVQAPRRARVPPRQIYAFAQAARQGWRGDAAGIVLRGVENFVARYQRSDGLFIALVSGDGKPLDLRANLYDQAFVLLAFAAAARALGETARFEHSALLLRAAIDRRLRAPDRGFFATDHAPVYRESNPHMHLLEACLAWAEIGANADWLRWAVDLADLGLSHFRHAQTGAVGEYFTRAWSPAPGGLGRVEPGHQFEWAWLLLRCPGERAPEFAAAAQRLIALGESSGVHGGVAVNELGADLGIRDPNARLWPQTERLKAAVAAAMLTGSTAHWGQAAAAAGSLFQYFDTRLPGLWFDRRLADGGFVDEPAPASSLYHIVCAIDVLDAALGPDGAAGAARS